MKQSYSSIFFPTNLTLEIPSGSKECTQDSHDASDCDFFADKSQAAPIFCKAFLNFSVMPEPQYNNGSKSLHKLHINFVSLVCFPHWMKKQPTSLHKRSRAWHFCHLTKKTPNPLFTWHFSGKSQHPFCHLSWQTLRSLRLEFENIYGTVLNKITTATCSM